MTTNERLRALLAEARQSNERAYRAITDLCSGKLRWEMRVPAEPDHDPDLIITAALRDADLIADALPALLDVAEAARDVASQALDHDDFVLIHRTDWGDFRAALAALGGGH